MEKENLAILKILYDLSESTDSIGLITIDQRMPGEFFEVIESGQLKNRVYDLCNNEFIHPLENNRFKISQKGIEKLKDYKMIK